MIHCQRSHAMCKKKLEVGSVGSHGTPSSNRFIIHGPYTISSSRMVYYILMTAKVSNVPKWCSRNWVLWIQQNVTSQSMTLQGLYNSPCVPGLCEVCRSSDSLPPDSLPLCFYVIYFLCSLFFPPVKTIKLTEGKT